MAAAFGLPLIGAAPIADPAHAGGAFAGHSAPAFAGHSAVGHNGPARIRPTAPRVMNAAPGQTRFAGSRMRFARRLVPVVYGSYAPYYASSISEGQPAVPSVVETTTPVYINFGAPAGEALLTPLCNGPKIIEIGAPQKPTKPLPRVIYGTPMNCIATHAAAPGPGIYDVD